MNSQSSTPANTSPLASNGMDSSSLGILPDFDLLMRQTLLQNMNEGVVCVDRQLKVTTWNRTMEELTGLNTSAMIGKTISPNVFKMSDRDSSPITDANCPFLTCLSSGESIQKEVFIAGRSGREMEVELSLHPIRSNNGETMGALALIHDTSVQTELHTQLTDMYIRTVLDPLTQVANRAEFERLLSGYIDSHRDTKLKCSIIICDIDFFKGINDNYGHHIGDQALIAFAGLLKQFVRKNDLVARYGGEEFVILCANCDEDAAVKRAEDIRFKLEKTPQSMLDHKCMTASFGVSQLEDSDDSMSFFVRADQALLKAKEMGRNRVVRGDVSAIKSDELGSGADQSVSGIRWRKLGGKKLIETEFQTRAPIEIVVEKIRCVIDELQGEVTSVSENHVTTQYRIADPRKPSLASFFQMEVDLRSSSPEDLHYDENIATYLRVIIQPGKSGWFHRNNDDLAEVLLRDFRQYLGLHEDSSELKVDRAVNSSGRDEQ